MMQFITLSLSLSLSLSHTHTHTHALTYINTHPQLLIHFDLKGNRFGWKWLCRKGGIEGDGKQVGIYYERARVRFTNE